MTTKTIECAECGASVPYGRLSCATCGALLASVAGGRSTRGRTGRPSKALAESEPEASLGAPDPGVPAPELGVPEPATAAAEPDPVEPTPVEDPRPVAAADGPEAGEGYEAEPVTETIDPGLRPAAFSLAPEPSAALPTPVRTPFDGPEPLLIARPYVRHVDPSEGRSYGAQPSSGYRAPTFALAAAAATGPSWSDGTTSVAPRSSIATTVSATADADRAPARSATAATARIAEIGTWFVIVGAAMGALGFLLPWSRVVIGARSIGGYLDVWGLASPTHVVVLLATLTVLGLGILRPTIAGWLWAGVMALGLGGLLIGLAWPYQFGPLGADVGVIIIALGGLALVIGGVVTTWATRHPEVAPAV